MSTPNKKELPACDQGTEQRAGAGIIIADDNKLKHDCHLRPNANT
jgi:hypothetical protein